MISAEQKKTLEKILVRVGDMGFRRRVIDIVNGLNLKGKEKVLDCGCGEGFYTLVLSQLYPDLKIVAFDHDKEILTKAKAWIGERKNVEWLSSEIEDGLPFKSGEFDRVIFSEVLEHLTDDVGALKEVARLIKKGGFVVITVPSANYPFLWDPVNFLREKLGWGHFSGSNQFWGGVWSWNHLRLYTPESLEKLIKDSGLKVEGMKANVRFCLPFNYWMLFVGKRLVNWIPLPKTVSKSLEKFEWQDEDTTSGGIANLLKAPVLWVDSLNDKWPARLDRRHLSLFAVARK